MNTVTRALLVLLIFLPLFASATTCEEATLVEALPYDEDLTHTGNNDITSANASVCGNASSLYLGGNEALLRYTADFTGELNIEYSGQTWTGLLVYAGCPTSGGTCLDGIGNSLSSKSLQVNVEAGQEYFILIDTWPEPPSPIPGVIRIEGTAQDPVFDDRFETIPEPFATPL